jgi:CP family cyanate transporter-like MFS transporter
LRIPAAGALGFGIGGCFGLGLTLIVLRAADAASAAGLSAMAQGIGYTGACLGPLVFGLAHEATGGWGVPGALFVAIAVAAILIGQAAGRDRKVCAGEPQARNIAAQPLTSLQAAKPASGS